MQRELKVMELMERADQLRRWRERQQRNAEWVALKQWWRADKRVRQAGTGLERWTANVDRAKTAWLYRAELKRAWPKWQRARAHRWGGIMPQGEADQP